ncbi:MAG: 4-oxalocrotonate tautomerase [Firmicutes bacterium HGW-Firmicutes-7]|nr:MAG: 4-oxalocrotonate tautomerase [Firmicutes bacterium HGW-Firmicutes-7]
MPVITIKIGKTQTEKKKELVEKLTNAAVEVTSIPASSFMVFVEEFELESIGVGGQTLAEKMDGK